MIRLLIATALFVISAPTAKAVNLMFLSGDATFIAAPSREKVVSLLEGESGDGPVKLLFSGPWREGVTACGYEGVNELILDSQLTKFRRLLKVVLDDAALWQEVSGSESRLAQGPRFIFCSTEFDIEKYSPFARNNQNLEKAFSEYRVDETVRRMVRKAQKQMKVAKAFPPAFAVHSSEVNCDLFWTKSAHAPVDYQVVVLPSAGFDQRTDRKGYRLVDGEIKTFDVSKVAGRKLEQ